MVDTGVNGSHHTLDQFNFDMIITDTASANVTHAETFMLDPTSHVWINAAHNAGFGGGHVLGSVHDALILA